MESLSCSELLTPSSIQIDKNSHIYDNPEKQSAIWTSSSTSILLTLYESKLEMLETPKKKTKIWHAISNDLKDYNIDMSPDQVRWKINALTKKYKQCIESGKHNKFKYFNEMDNIYANYNVDCESCSITHLLQKKKGINNIDSTENMSSTTVESKSMIELRKIRLANRIESDRNQTKIILERQWLEFLKRNENDNQIYDDFYERDLKLRKEKLDLYKRELELKKTLEYKKIQLIENECRDMLKIEREKCALLKHLISLSYNVI